MGTFVYAPGVRIYIKTENSGILDVSDDLIDYTVQRRSDGPSTLNFSIQNVQRKYDGLFSPNDEVIVEMKRVSWVRVFTGLLNSVPLVTMWPRVVAFSASCSLKRLQYWYWDPQLASTWTEATIAMANGKGTADAGITNVILTLLRDVVGWPENKAHIGAIPANWFQLVIPYAKTLADQLVAPDAQVAAFLDQYGIGSVGGTTVNGGTTSTGSTASTAATGIFGSKQFSNMEGGNLTDAQLKNAEIIIRVGRATAGIPDTAILAALIAAMGESRLNNLAKNTTSSATGLFQQLKSWGTEAQRTDPQWSSQWFFRKALQMKDLASASSSIIAADVQGYRYGHGRYTSYSIQAPVHDKFLPMAQQLLAAFGQSAGAAAGDSPSISAGQAVTSGASAYISPSSAFVQKARTLTRNSPTIPYGDTSMSDIKRTTPRALGCSGFISWVIYQAIGHLPSGWPLQNAQGQYQWCLSNGGKELSLADAAKTAGALLIRHPNTTHDGHFQSVGHIEISVGDGVHSIGATNKDTFAGEHQIYLGQYDTAVLLPLYDYRNAYNANSGPPPVYSGGATYDANGNPTGRATVPYSSTAGYDPTNPIDKLFGNAIQINGDIQKQLENDMALAFSGPRALLNDQPLLPYIKNLVNASMRSFCSAPNGDFMAWFPDYYGLWGTAAIMTIEPVELQDFYVEWTDDYFVTHQYTMAGTVNYFDGFQGNINPTFTPPDSGTATPFADDRITTAGIASIDIPAIMYALFGISLDPQQAEAFRQHIYKKFGARPDYKEMDGMVGKTAEIFSAMYYFMRQWTYQYNANVPLTFMPELWPGMLLQIPEYNFQCYVTAVTHSGQMGEGGGHQTMVNVAAPARLPDGTNTHHLIGLPVASGVLDISANVMEKVPAISAQAQKNARLLDGSP